MNGACLVSLLLASGCGAAAVSLDAMLAVLLRFRWLQGRAIGSLAETFTAGHGTFDRFQTYCG